MRTKLDRPQLQSWFASYIQRLTGLETRKRELHHLVRDVFESPSWQATDQIPINPRWSTWKQHYAELWNSKGQLFADLAHALDPGIQPYVAAGIMAVETGQEFFRRGRAIARFEAHVFWHRWGNTSQERRRVFNQHFRRSRPHQWRRNISDRFQGYHGNQAKEWEVLDFARSLDSLADIKAVEATSFGAGQTMGFNYGRVGFSSPLEMLEHYQTRERAQIEGIFNYIATIRPESRRRRVIAAIRQENFLPLSQAYGPQNPQGYAQRIAQAVRTIRRLVEDNRRRQEAATEGQMRGVR